MKTRGRNSSRGTTILVVSGTMGAGKTTILGEASDLLSKAGIAHAAIDLDAIDIGYIPDGLAEELTMKNLAAVWNNYAAAGIDRLLVAEAVDSQEKREGLRRAIPGADIVICRLRADLETMRERIRVREPGILQATFIRRVEELDQSLNAAAVEDFSVENSGRNVTEVAREMLTRAGWLNDEQGADSAPG